MARSVVVKLVDDLDYSSDAVETVSFALDGVEYEIDLSDENARRLRDVFHHWIALGRKVRAGEARRKQGKDRSATERARSTAIRQWARKNGYQVLERGRLQTEVVSAYLNETGRSADPSD